MNCFVNKRFSDIEFCKEEKTCGYNHESKKQVVVIYKNFTDSKVLRSEIGIQEKKKKKVSLKKDLVGSECKCESTVPHLCKKLHNILKGMKLY